MTSALQNCAKLADWKLPQFHSVSTSVFPLIPLVCMTSLSLSVQNHSGARINKSQVACMYILDSRIGILWGFKTDTIERKSAPFCFNYLRLLHVDRKFGWSLSLRERTFRLGRFFFLLLL